MRVEVVIEKAGGVRRVAEELGISSQAVYKWLRDGYIPMKKMRAVAEMAGTNPERLPRREIP